MNKDECKGIFVFAEQREGEIKNVAFELIGKACELAETIGEEVTALLLGDKISPLAQSLIEAGADNVLVVDSPELKDYLTEPYTQAITHIIKTYKPEVLLIGASTIGRDLGPRVSARVQTGLTADCTALAISDERDLLMTRPAFGGNLMATIICKEHRPQISTVRPGVMRRRPSDKSRQGRIEQVKVDFDSSAFKVRLVKKEKRKEKDLVDITEAKILVSGGRGVGSQDGFSKLAALASCINAEVSSSRAMVDAGLMDHDRQVGQTGKTVRPDVYFACGISGAIQHLAGMEESEFIIAINKDKFAPIFNVADLGIVADLTKVIPLLTQKLQKAQMKT